MIAPAARSFYVVNSLSGTPTTVQGLLGRFDASDPVWDTRPDPERFSLREIVAHLADWEQIWLHRVQRAVQEVDPHLENYDPGKLAVERDYAHRDPVADIARLRQGRDALVTTLRSLTEEQWQRTMRRDDIGSFSIEVMAVLALGHDGYHTAQIAEWTVG